MEKKPKPFLVGLGLLVLILVIIFAIRGGKEGGGILVVRATEDFADLCLRDLDGSMPDLSLANRGNLSLNCQAAMTELDLDNAVKTLTEIVGSMTPLPTSTPLPTATLVAQTPTPTD